jgi:glutamate-ammonia-ligase adenylyltransferase
MKNPDNSLIFKQATEKAQDHSQFLSRLISLHPDIVSGLCENGADIIYGEFCENMRVLSRKEWDQTELMRELRFAKGKLALLVALADIAGIWELEKVTAALSDFAQDCLIITIRHLLAAGKKRGDITHGESKDSGLIILGMGKLGGRELNYSSDIDLIIFYEPGKLGYKGRYNEQHFMNKLAHELVSIMQDRTQDGYVFRTDLRLRPDPASTPPAVTVDAAYNYYESVGQNWERAAMIKARPVAGDMEAGEIFMKSLTPFMWRRSLDFAAINDIHSIKRQMDSRENKQIKPQGHNIKLGLGGIREIEFYTQIHQLIWGGREPSLRLHATCDTMIMLREFGLITPDKEATLRAAYVFLRTLEHRIQMVADEQTHNVPDTDAGFKNIAGFMGYKNPEEFAGELLKHLYAVHEIYSTSFRSAENLGDTGNLVFTGATHDEETLKTLRTMGYNQPEVVSEIVMGWHHGSTRATRTKRARELLTEMMPALLKRLSETANPDVAFLKFNEFLQRLPASIQLFSLFQMNPQLLGLIADIMGSAPTLANTLSHTPELLDAVIYEDFYLSLPTRGQMEAQLLEKLKHVEFFEDHMDNLCQFRNEKQFQAGVHFLKHMIDAQQTGEFLTILAECVINQALAAVILEFEKTYGKIAGSRFAIIALGKLGSRELTFLSDIDLVFVYDAPDMEEYSDGEKSFTASVYYNRLTQRLLNALTGMGRDGRLYEVDTRLRPSGQQGSLAVSKPALVNYFEGAAWTFEYMAFTKARVIAGDKSLVEELEFFIIKQMTKQRDMDKLQNDVADMRERIAKEYPDDNPWDIKYARGGLIDIDFIAQYLILHHAPNLVGTRSGSAGDIFAMLKHAGCIDEKTAGELLAANQFLEQLFNMLRLCSDNKFDSKTAPEGLKKLLVETVGE